MNKFLAALLAFAAVSFANAEEAKKDETPVVAEAEADKKPTEEEIKKEEQK